ncbi:hypothetical protein BDO18943_05389 [Burkholderia dolosa]|nr:hypothetical protein BDO18943_05389 [Burkholderia dolosa]
MLGGRARRFRRDRRCGARIGERAGSQFNVALRFDRGLIVEHVLRSVREEAICITLTVRRDIDIADTVQVCATCVRQLIRRVQIELVRSGEDSGGAGVRDHGRTRRDVAADHGSSIVERSAVGRDRIAFNAARVVDRAAVGVDRRVCRIQVRTALVVDVRGIQRQRAVGIHHASVRQPARRGKRQVAVRVEPVRRGLRIVAADCHRTVAAGDDRPVPGQCATRDRQILIATNRAALVRQSAGLNRHAATATRVIAEFARRIVDRCGLHRKDTVCANRAILVRQRSIRAHDVQVVPCRQDTRIIVRAAADVQCQIMTGERLAALRVGESLRGQRNVTVAADRTGTRCTGRIRVRNRCAAVYRRRPAADVGDARVTVVDTGTRQVERRRCAVRFDLTRMVVHRALRADFQIPVRLDQPRRVGERTIRLHRQRLRCEQRAARIVDAASVDRDVAVTADRAVRRIGQRVHRRDRQRG